MPHDGGGALYRVAPDGKPVLVRRFAGLKPEGITVAEDGKALIVVFDNDTRCLFATNFDGPWDAYVEDVVRFCPAEFYDEVFGYFEGYPEAGIKSVSLDDIKKLINDNQVTASAYSKRYTDVTVKEIDKALRLQKAFQKVLDTPGADKALEHPALKPLLAEAAD